MSDRAEKQTPPKAAKSGSQTRQRSKLAAMPCTPAELDEIKERAARAGLNVSGYLRAAIFGKEAEQPRAAKRPPVEAAELGALRYELRKIGGNLNQIAHHLNQGQEYDSRALTVVCAEHTAVLRAILAALGRGEPPP